VRTGWQGARQFSLPVRRNYKMTVKELLTKYKFKELSEKINYYDIPKTDIPSTENGAEEFNAIYKTLILENNYGIKKIKRTPSGGIKKHRHITFEYDIQILKNSIELTYIGPEGMHRWVFNGRPEGITGGDSFKEFKKICKKYDINLDNYAISNGKEVKETIEKPMIELYGVRDRIYINANHLDINSSYMAGIANAQPELKEVITDIYNKRKTNKVCKDILTHTYGYMQCKWCKVSLDENTKVPYAFAHLSKAAVEFNNRYIENLIKKLIASGRKVLATNTDGIWYTGEVYHDENEGKELGQWKNDHTNCQIRFKSKGCYEYIENDKYTPVVRGATKLDRMKERSEWEWGDIYQEECDIIKYKFDESVGIIAEHKLMNADVILFEEI
jgi:hypothetical protein